jgi:enoyl-CoA hydratase/carnithine racemase
LLTLEIHNHIGVLGMNQPAKRNAFDSPAWTALGKILESVCSSKLRVLLIRSWVKGTFCAGADLKALSGLAAATEETRAQFRIDMAQALTRLAEIGIPTIAVVEGDCYGAGVALALACDFMIASPNARFGITPAKLGILYPEEDVKRLVAAVGERQASRLLYSGAAIDAAEALRIGLVQQLADDASEVGLAVGAQVAANAPTSVRTLKAVVRGSETGSDYAKRFDDRFASPDFAEGAMAVRERRQPNFDEY